MKIEGGREEEKLEISSSDLSVGNKGSFQSFRGDKVKQIPRCKITGCGTLFLFGSSSRTGPPSLSILCVPCE